MENNPVVRFEIGCRNLEETAAFYSNIFGWAAPVTGPAAYINTNSADGIQGHITALGHEPHQYITFYIQVRDITAYLQKITESGGKKIVGPITLPTGQQFAWFNDPGGNIVGLVTKPA
jgi:predicted enzyme related to lactoylglutathione lyase